MRAALAFFFRVFTAGAGADGDRAAEKGEGAEEGSDVFHDLLDSGFCATPVTLTQIEPSIRRAVAQVDRPT